MMTTMNRVWEVEWTGGAGREGGGWVREDKDEREEEFNNSLCQLNNWSKAH